MQHKGIPSKALNCFEKSVGAFIIIACVLSFAPARPASSQTSTAQGATAPGESELTRLVNPFVGTDNDGNTFPGATVPFGMVQLSPDTTSTGWYKCQDTKIRGFSLTHFSGAGCPAYADVPFLPAVGPLKSSPGSNWSDYAAAFSHDKEQAAPGYYAVELNSGVRVELSATARTGFGVFNFPSTTEANLLVNAGGSATGDSDSSVQIWGDREVVGHATSGRFCDSDTSYTVYFAAQFDRAFNSFGIWEADALKHDARESRGKQTGAVLSFDATRVRTLKMKVGVSFVNIENARMNLRAENGGGGFEGGGRPAGAVWEGWLWRKKDEGGAVEGRPALFTCAHPTPLHP